MNNDFEIDDILSSRKKKIKSGAKGKRSERLIVNLLNNRFDKILNDNKSWGKFSRSVGSGNRWGQKVSLSTQIEAAFASDLVCPPSFRFSIESKSGYNEIDFFSIFVTGNRELDVFLDQVSRDAERAQKDPLLLWKKDRRPLLAFFIDKDNLFSKTEYKLVYRNWIATSLETLLRLPDEYFFQMNNAENVA
jgi:hypothetical protein